MAETRPQEDPVDATSADTRDIYICYDAQDLERAAEVLEEAGIESMPRDTSSSAFPLSTGTQGRKTLAVLASDEAAARLRLQEAQEDGVLSTEGIIAGLEAGK